MVKFKCRFCANQGVEAWGNPGHGDWTKPMFSNTKPMFSNTTRVECENGHRWSVPKLNKEKAE
jgi:hypothetical protein